MAAQVTASAALAAPKITDKVAYLKTTEKFKVGTKYEGRSGLRSLMDGPAQAKRLEDYNDRYNGDASGKGRGVYNLKVLQADGATPAKETEINIGGRLFRSNDKGDLRILDSNYIAEEVAAAKSQRQYEESIIESCLVSNFMATHILGATEFAKLAAGAGPSGDLNAVEAFPDSIRYMDPTSANYARAIAKLRIIVHEAGVIINEQDAALPAAGTLASSKKESSQSWIMIIYFIFPFI